MAVITQLNQDDQTAGTTTGQGQNNNGTSPGQSSVQPVGGSSGQATTSVGSPSASATVTNNAAPSSGTFTNLQSYLNANKGAGATIANKIGQNVQQSADQTNKDVAATGVVQTQLDAEKNRLAQTSGFASQVAQDPTQIANDANQTAAFQQIYNGTNNADAINSVAQNKLSTVNNDLQTLQQNAANTASEGGRFQLLQQALGRPSYSQGQQNLDNLLVQSQGGQVLNNLQNTAQQTAANAQNQVGAVNSNLTSGVADIQAQSAADKTALQNAIGGLETTTGQGNGTGALGALQNSIEGRMNDFDTTNTNLLNQINAQKATNNYTYNVAQMLGLTNGENLYDVDTASMINPTFSAGNVNQQNIATQDDVNRYNALAKLAGVDPSYINSATAGTAQGVQVDPTALDSALASRQTDYNNVMASPTAQNLQSILSAYDNSGFTNAAVKSALAQYNGQYTPAAAQAAIAALQAASPNALAAAISSQGGTVGMDGYLYGQSGLDNINRTYQLYNLANAYAPFANSPTATVTGGPATVPATTQDPSEALAKLANKS